MLRIGQRVRIAPHAPFDAGKEGTIGNPRLDSRGFPIGVAFTPQKKFDGFREAYVEFDDGSATTTEFRYLITVRGPKAVAK